jgi:hypothetical protein
VRFPGSGPEFDHGIGKIEGGSQNTRFEGQAYVDGLDTSNTPLAGGVASETNRVGLRSGSA